MESENITANSQKRCIKCGNLFPATPQYFVQKKQGINGLGSYCKPCQRLYSQQWYQTHREQVLKKQSEYRKAHPEQYRRYSAAFRKRYPEKVRETNLRISSANREDRRERARRYSQEHPGYQKRWRENNRDKYHAKTHRRRSLELGASGSFTHLDIDIIRKNQRGKCWYCGTDLSKTGEHIDHRVPLSRGGSNWPENLVLTCPKCNLSKGSKLPHEWNGRLL